MIATRRLSAEGFSKHMPDEDPEILGDENDPTERALILALISRKIKRYSGGASTPEALTRGGCSAAIIAILTTLKTEIEAGMHR